MIKSFEIITIFPKFFEPFFKTKIFERGLKKVPVHIHDLRDYTRDKRKTVDDTPYGGGCGMVLKPEPLSMVLNKIKSKNVASRKVIYLSPQGKLFDQEYAQNLLDVEEVVIISGRYEGIDQRIIDLYVDEELSIGDFVLGGGELAAMIVLETSFRLIPGILGNEESYKTDTFSNGLLKFPQYTKPQSFMGKSVPEILISGDHEKIEKWRMKKSLEKTKKIRPDLFERHIKTFGGGETEK